MPLRRFPPISRAAQWRETLTFIDPRTRAIMDLTDVTLTLAMYQPWRAACRSDYGWSRLGGGPWRDYGIPLVAARTQDDGSGNFVILPGARKALVTFLPADLCRLDPGPVLFLGWATRAGQTDEVLRDELVVLEGPTAMPDLPAAVPEPPPPAPQINVVVTVDGGEG